MKKVFSWLQPHRRRDKFLLEYTVALYGIKSKSRDRIMIFGLLPPNPGYGVICTQTKFKISSKIVYTLCSFLPPCDESQTSDFEQRQSEVPG